MAGLFLSIPAFLSSASTSPPTRCHKWQTSYKGRWPTNWWIRCNSSGRVGTGNLKIRAEEVRLVKSRWFNSCWVEGRSSGKICKQLSITSFSSGCTPCRNENKCKQTFSRIFLKQHTFHWSTASKSWTIRSTAQPSACTQLITLRSVLHNLVLDSDKISIPRAISNKMMPADQISDLHLDVYKASSSSVMIDVSIRWVRLQPNRSTSGAKYFGYLQKIKLVHS